MLQFGSIWLNCWNAGTCGLTFSIALIFCLHKISRCGSRAISENNWCVSSNFEINETQKTFSASLFWKSCLVSNSLCSMTPYNRNWFHKLWEKIFLWFSIVNQLSHVTWLSYFQLDLKFLAVKIRILNQENVQQRLVFQIPKLLISN